jgi:ribosome-associated translation inhibitor RaiA
MKASSPTLFDASAKQHIERLRSAYPDLVRCEVTLQDRAPRRYERKRFNVRVDLDYAGSQLVINREHEADPAAALDEAFEAACWNLQAVQAARHLRS